MCHKPVIEPYELTSDERTIFFDDLDVAGGGLQAAFQADKMNYNILGNLVPHLHVQNVPRYFSDSAPHRPIDPGLNGHEVYLSAAEYADRTKSIQKQMGAG